LLIDYKKINLLGFVGGLFFCTSIKISGFHFLTAILQVTGNGFAESRDHLDVFIVRMIKT